MRVPAISERMFFMNQQYSYIIEEIGNRRNKKSPRRHKANGGKRKENMNTIILVKDNARAGYAFFFNHPAVFIKSEITAVYISYNGHWITSVFDIPII